MVTNTTARDWLLVQVSMCLYCDNKAAINIAHNPIQHDRAKHIEVDKNFIREKLLSGLVCIPFVVTKQQLADMLTKGLHKSRLIEITGKLGMYDIHISA